MNLTNEQIARVFAMSMPCKAQWKDPQGDLVDTILNGIVKDVWKQKWLGKTMWNGMEFLEPIENFKPFSIPLSAITDEDAIEVYRMERGNKRHSNFIDTKEAIEYNQFNLTYPTFQYLIQKGYAVPLFIEVGHPDNGKTAIELGLAIDKTLKSTTA